MISTVYGVALNAKWGNSLFFGGRGTIYSASGVETEGQKVHYPLT